LAIQILRSEINWPKHTANLRIARTSNHRCRISGELIEKGEKVYVITLWNAGLAGKKFPDYVLPEYIEEYMRKN
jgi:hypothetical protein